MSAPVRLDQSRRMPPYVARPIRRSHESQRLTAQSARRRHGGLFARNQVAVWTASTATYLTWQAPSMGVRWRLLLATAIVTRSLPPSADFGKAGLSPWEAVALRISDLRDVDPDRSRSRPRLQGIDSGLFVDGTNRDGS